MSLPVQAGDVLASKYRVERVLGSGGMGVVVAARHVQLDQVVALKFMKSDALENQRAVDRFLREARAAAQLKSDHAGRVLDVGTLDDGAPYIVMEYLEGRDLAALLKERGALPVEEAVEYLLHACAAMAEAHAYGIVHRDLKPHNLFLVLRPDGTPLVKVLDFGVAKAYAPSSSSDTAFDTKTAAVLGSPAYMSPEQMQSSRDVDPRTDVYALGVVLYQLVSGRLPFEAETVAALCAKVIYVEPTPLSDAKSGLPRGLGVVVARCLTKDRTKRFASMVDLASALAPYSSERGRALLPLITALSRSRPTTPLGSPSLSPADAPSQSLSPALGGAPTQLDSPSMAMATTLGLSAS